MRFINAILVLMALVMLCSAGQALQAFSGDTVSIDSAVADDIIAAGNMVSINAPVDSAIVAGGTVNINAPVKGDVIAAGGQVYVNADVGGKVVTAGGNVNLGGNIGTNLIVAAGQVNILPGKMVGRDALIGGGQVVNAGHVNGTITVSANQFNNTGSAGLVKFYKAEDPSPKREDYDTGFSIFSLLAMLGYFILGLILVKSVPGIFQAVDGEVRSSTLLKTLLGFVMIIASFIALLLVAATVIGLPIAVISSLLIFAALMLSGTFVSFSLGKWIGERAKIKQGDLVYFVIGFVIINVLSLLPLVGGLVSLISMSLGFAAILYAARRLTAAGPTLAA
jgi:cytoskeletal protein CcmA (bactofilin family)